MGLFAVTLAQPPILIASPCPHFPLVVCGNRMLLTRRDIGHASQSSDF